VGAKYAPPFPPPGTGPGSRTHSTKAVCLLSTKDGNRPKTGSSHPRRIRSRRIRIRIRRGNGICHRIHGIHGIHGRRIVRNRTW